MSNIINKVKDALSGDHTHTTTTGTTATTGTAGNTYTTGTTGTAEGVAGPHSSRLANTLDPRVDSDKDGSRRVGTTTGTTGMTGNNYTTGTAGTTVGTAEGVAGPHSSRLANALDPRVDSDMDGSRRVGTTTGTTGMTGNNYTTGTAGTTVGTAEGVAGPHSSRLANALDPRVDSDMDGSRRVGTTTGTTGMTGNNLTTGTTGTVEGVAGPHSSRLANTLDPRVDSDMDGSTSVGGTTAGRTGMTGGNTYTTGTTGTAATTSTTGGLGPHSVS